MRGYEYMNSVTTSIPKPASQKAERHTEAGQGEYQREHAPLHGSRHLGLHNSADRGIYQRNREQEDKETGCDPNRALAHPGKRKAEPAAQRPQADAQDFAFRSAPNTDPNTPEQ